MAQPKKKGGGKPAKASPAVTPRQKRAEKWSRIGLGLFAALLVIGLASRGC